MGISLPGCCLTSELKERFSERTIERRKEMIEDRYSKYEPFLENGESEENLGKVPSERFLKYIGMMATETILLLHRK